MAGSSETAVGTAPDPRLAPGAAPVARTLKKGGPPMWLLAELTYRCPLHCVFCSNPVDYAAHVPELANTQYYGWAWQNRAQLMPTPDELREAEAKVNVHKARLAGKMKIFWVSPDYVDAKAKPCMAGWGAVFLVVAPDGTALPCHSARMLPGFDFPKVTEHSIAGIWRDSDAFNRYRGTAWMSDTCLSCDQHPVDHGGCRCQAFLVTGDAAATDPVCPKSPDRPLIDAALQAAVEQAEAAPATQPLRFVPGAARSGNLWYRTDANSRTLSDDGQGPQHDTAPAAAETR